MLILFFVLFSVFQISKIRNKNAIRNLFLQWKSREHKERKVAQETPLPSQGVVHGGEEAGPDGTMRDQSRVFNSTPQSLSQSPAGPGEIQAHTQTSRINIMKWLFLQLLTLYCLVILPVTGSFRRKIKTTAEPPKYSRYSG